MYALNFLLLPLSHLFWDIRQTRPTIEGVVQLMSVHAKTVQNLVITFIPVCYCVILCYYIFETLQNIRSICLGIA